MHEMVEIVAPEKDRQEQGRTAAGERRERLAAELRANLKKRKARTRSVSRDANGDIRKPR